MPGFGVENRVWPLPYHLRENPSLVSNITTVYTTYVPNVIYAGTKASTV